MINHDVVRLHVTVHDALRVAVVESFQDLEHVVANVEIVEALIEFAEVSITRVNKLSDNGRSLGQGVSDNVNKLDNVDSVLQGLQDLDLTSDLVLLDCEQVTTIRGRETRKMAGNGDEIWEERLTRLEDFNDDTLVGLRIDALVYFRVLASANLFDNFVVVLGPTLSVSKLDKCQSIAIILTGT